MDESDDGEVTALIVTSSRGTRSWPRIASLLLAMPPRPRPECECDFTLSTKAAGMEDMVGGEEEVASEYPAPVN